MGFKDRLEMGIEPVITDRGIGGGECHFFAGTDSIGDERGNGFGDHCHILIGQLGF